MGSLNCFTTRDQLAEASSTVYRIYIERQTNRTRNIQDTDYVQTLPPSLCGMLLPLILTLYQRLKAASPSLHFGTEHADLSRGLRWDCQPAAGLQSGAYTSIHKFLTAACCICLLPY
jgi:hypothetical protein